MFTVIRRQRRADAWRSAFSCALEYNEVEMEQVPDWFRRLWERGWPRLPGFILARWEIKTVRLLMEGSVGSFLHWGLFLAQTGD